MNFLIDNGYYSIEYDEKKFENLKFIRADQICGVSYVTLKNIVTGEIYTFDEKRIKKWQTKFNLRTPSQIKHKNHVADMETYSLY